MKPIIIFQFIAHEGPGYLGDFLDAQQIKWQLVKVDENEPLPTSILAYSGMVLMGGPMSVNDDLPWIAPLLDLIREADINEIPLLGHCLGGQLISKAFGAVVSKNPVKEIGWGEVAVSKNGVAKQWFGDIEVFNSFHWHGETFSLPQGATHLLFSPYCVNQAYALGKHLVLQCHIEMTSAMVKQWCEVGADELAEAKHSPAVQQAQIMQHSLPIHCFFLNKMAEQLYTQWIKGLRLS
ncbi:type 1 glutamine amidotransferase [Methylotenera versatilis]|uniref:type 1 glutamine amidotransferase n=1 Tax=Methylotenera versatilis TaxID=1055487 RepID=UPI00064838D3|nr:type 1 glutamine amidotransferase [Methylotenera versatilis]